MNCADEVITRGWLYHTIGNWERELRRDLLKGSGK
jgi:hypothetical protein